MNIEQFRKTITEGIPSILPKPKSPNPNVPHAPVRKDILTDVEKELALKNALRYFPAEHHAVLAPEFAQELSCANKAGFTLLIFYVCCTHTSVSS